MKSIHSAGQHFRQAVETEQPLAIVGTINAYSALQAKHSGFRAIYLSGSGVAAASYGLPDLGLTQREHVLIDVERITAICDLPMLVDIDTGWGGPAEIAKTITLMETAGVAAVHIEDQIADKRCGHRPGKTIVSVEEMVSRISACVDARHDPSFVIMARTDAFANEGLAAMIERSQHYIAAGADMLFAEALTELSHYQALTQAVTVPVLANITEFGQTPLLTQKELANVGIAMALYPLTAFRAMSQAALNVYQTLRQQGSQKPLLDCLQTREALYDTLDYFHYEAKLDAKYKSSK